MTGDKERAQFEAWLASIGGRKLHQYDDGEYKNSYVQAQWEGWQARAAESPKVTEEAPKCEWDRRRAAYEQHLRKYPGDANQWRAFYAGCEADEPSKSPVTLSPTPEFSRIDRHRQNLEFRGAFDKWFATQTDFAGLHDESKCWRAALWAVKQSESAQTRGGGTLSAQEFGGADEVNKILYQMNDYPKVVRDSIRPTIDALRKLRDALSSHNTAELRKQLSEIKKLADDHWEQLVDMRLRKESAEAELLRLRGAGWVSVEERLPENETRTLISFKRRDNSPHTATAYFLHGRWWSEGAYTQDVPNVTYWQPLPSPPAEGAGPQPQEKP
jgi:hypothetical protein